MSILTSIGLLGLIASPAAAFWRLRCVSPIVVERADPIVNPGQLSGHLHTIMGGNAFGFNMDSNTALESTCTSCVVDGDFSNYWTPNLWYQNQDGSFESVGQNGGATVYYLQRTGGRDTKLQAFPDGFRMLAGDPNKRSYGNDFPSEAVSYVCLSGNVAEGHAIPNVNCPGGLRAQIFFPSCWDGVNLDSADHKSHMSYPIGAHDNGYCPDSHPVQLVSIFYEVIFNVDDFKNRWYGSGHPFVLSNGDPTGYGFHGDFVMGWNRTLLQSAVNDCTNLSGNLEDCSHFNLIPDTVAQGCRIASQVDEPVTGKLPALPGCNPVQAGPNPATPQSNCGATTSISQAASFFTDLTSKGWSYTGCGQDNYFSRALTGADTSSDDMTNEMCVDFCGGKGFSVAATEYNRECYCGNSIPSSAMPVPGVVGTCTSACVGDSTQNCGGYSTMSLYQQCTGSSCTNAQVGNVNQASGSSSSGSSSSAASSAVSSAVSSASSVLSSVPSAAVSLASSASGTAVAKVQTTQAASSSAAAAPTSASTSANTQLTLPTSWTYTGCYSDGITPRTLPVWSTFNGNTMTNQACVSFCDTAGYSMAGTEYSGQCFCGNSLSGSTKQDDAKCSMACTGDNGQVCGGGSLLSVFSKASSQGKRSEDVAGHRSGHLRMHRRWGKDTI